MEYFIFSCLVYPKIIMDNPTWIIINFLNPSCQHYRKLVIIQVGLSMTIDTNRCRYQTACLESGIMLCQDGSNADLMAVEVSKL